MRSNLNASTGIADRSRMDSLCITAICQRDLETSAAASEGHLETLTFPRVLSASRLQSDRTTNLAMHDPPFWDPTSRRSQMPQTIPFIHLRSFRSEPSRTPWYS